VYSLLEKACHIDVPLLLTLADHFDHDRGGQVENSLFSVHVNIDDVEAIPASSETLVFLHV